MTEIGFVAVVLVIAAQRLVELGRSRDNAARMLARGGREHAAHQMPWMVLLHATWLGAMLVEVLVIGRPFQPAIALLAAIVFAAGQRLRRSARRALGWRWTARIITVPGVPLVRSGPYRFLSHPNYLGVALEVAALPLLHSAWITALCFSALNAVMLWRRIRAENLALGRGRAAERR